MNHAIFAGRLGRDADLRVTPSGQNVLNFSVAVDVGFGDNKRTLWIACALWGERGERLAPYLTKGKSVTVAGDVDLRTYETRDHEARAELTLNVQRLTLQGSPAAEGQADGQRTATTAQPARQAAQPAAATTSSQPDFDDDIPF